MTDTVDPKKVQQAMNLQSSRLRDLFEIEELLDQEDKLDNNNEKPKEDFILNDNIKNVRFKINADNNYNNNKVTTSIKKLSK